jgi:hypothetical protein
MVIYHSYVSLPEGNQHKIAISWGLNGITRGCQWILMEIHGIADLW